MGIEDYFSHIVTGVFRDVMAGPSLGISDPDPPDLPSDLKGMVIPHHRLKDILILLRTVWDEVPHDRWKIDILPSRGQKLIQVEIGIDSRYSIRMNFGKDATVVMIVDASPPPGTGLMARTIERMALRNDSWGDFQGWISLSRTVYDEELNPTMRPGGVF